MFERSPDPRVGSPTGTIIFGSVMGIIGVLGLIFIRSGHGPITGLPDWLLEVTAIVCSLIMIGIGIRNRSKV